MLPSKGTVVLASAAILSACAIVLGFQDEKIRIPVGERSPAPRVPAKIALVDLPTGSRPVAHDSIAKLAEELENKEFRKINQSIRDTLEKPVALPFEKPTPLSEVIKHLKEVTRSPELPAGLPIFLDPSGLLDADSKLEATIILDARDVPLKAALPRVLKPLSLVWYIKDGTLVFAADDGDELPSPLKTVLKKAEDGELTIVQYQSLIEILRLRNEVLRLESEKKKISGEGPMVEPPGA